MSDGRRGIEGSAGGRPRRGAAKRRVRRTTPQWKSFGYGLRPVPRIPFDKADGAAFVLSLVQVVAAKPELPEEQGYASWLARLPERDALALQRLADEYLPSPVEEESLVLHRPRAVAGRIVPFRDERAEPVELPGARAVVVAGRVHGERLVRTVVVVEAQEPVDVVLDLVEGMYTDTPEREREKINQARIDLSNYLNVVKLRQEGYCQLKLGIAPWAMSHVIGAYFNRFMISDKKFTVDSDVCVYFSLLLPYK